MAFQVRVHPLRAGAAAGDLAAGGGALDDAVVLRRAACAPGSGAGAGWRWRFFAGVCENFRLRCAICV